MMYSKNIYYKNKVFPIKQLRTDQQKTCMAYLPLPVMSPGGNNELKTQVLDCDHCIRVWVKSYQFGFNVNSYLIGKS